jgi:hypothetical protein
MNEFLRDLKHFYDDFSMVFGNELCVFHFSFGTTRTSWNLD